MTDAAAAAGGAPSARPSPRAPFADRLPVLLAAVLTLHGLWRWPLWEDEIFTWNLATQLPLAKVFELSGKDKHPPGYFLLEWVFGRLGDSDAWIRLPSGVAAVVAVALVVRLGRRLGVGALGAWLLPLLPFFLVYGPMARAYALLMALGAGLLAASFEAPRRAAVGIAIFGALGLYAHYAMALPLVAALAAMATRAWVDAPPGNKLRSLLPAIAAAAGAVVAFLPWALVATGSQAARESRQAPNLAVLEWALWPVAGFVPYVAWPMLALALVGVGLALRGRVTDQTGAAPARAVLAPWIVAALVLPILASTRSITATKTYVFAPLLPLFVLLCAAGLRWLAGRLRDRLGARAPIVVAAPLVLLLLPDVHAVLTLPAAPLELGLVATGSRDPRRDAELLAALAPDLNPRLLDNRAWTPYQRYLPAAAMPLDQPRFRTWYGWRRTEGAEATAMSEGALDNGCFFRRAFLNLVMVTNWETCRALRDRIAASAEATGYPPFLLQAADFARDRGETAEAERLAARAVGGMGPSVEPELFVARRQLERGDADAALATLVDAVPRARRWGDDANLSLLFTELNALATRRGDTAAAESAATAAKCARSGAPLRVCGTWLQRFWDVETTSRSGRGGQQTGGAQGTGGGAQGTGGGAQGTGGQRR